MSADRCELLCLDLPRAEQVRASVMDASVIEQVAETGKALGEPTRLVLAVALREGGELCVCDLAWISGRSEKLVSHHLGVLRRAGIARSRRQAKMVFYALTADGVTILSALLATAAVQVR